MSDSNGERERLEQRFADMKAILEARQRLKDAKRSLYLVNRKRARRAARVQAALQAFEDIITEVDAAQAALKIAQQANDRAFLDAANHGLENDRSADQLAADGSLSTKEQSHEQREIREL